MLWMLLGLTGLASLGWNGLSNALAVELGGRRAAAAPAQPCWPPGEEYRVAVFGRVRGARGLAPGAQC